MQPFKAWIVPVEETAPTPPGIWGGGNVPMPSPPIANVPGAPGYTPPGQPPGIWGPNDPRPQPPIPIYPGGTPNPPGIWGPGSGLPTPPIPIYPGGTPNPPGIWGGGNVPMPNPPIHLPPGIWGGGNEPFPTPPIELPEIPGGPSAENPINKPPTDDPRWVHGYIPGVGWIWVLVPDGAPLPPTGGSGEGEQKKGVFGRKKDGE